MGKKRKKKKKFWSSDKLVALTALFISVSTLFIFIRQTNIIEEQSHLSVLPYLMMDSSINYEKMQYSVDLKNFGVGPALIEKRELFYKDKVYEMELRDFLMEVMPVMDSVKALNYSTIQVGLAIPSGGIVNLITAGGDIRSFNTFKTNFEKLLEDGFRYRITYKSIYQDRWQITSETQNPEKLK